MNKLLMTLPEDQRVQIEECSRTIPLRRAHMLYEVGDTIDRAYFVLDGMISLLAVFRDGSVAEVTCVGPEGFVGVGSILDDDLAIARAVVQLPGSALSIATEDLKRLCIKHRELQRLMDHYCHALISQLSHCAACNAIHSAKDRLCRWLLMCHDCVKGDVIDITQELLSQMLGVQRPTVAVITAELEENGLIGRARGQITIRGRKALEHAACECYGDFRTHYKRLIA